MNMMGKLLLSVVALLQQSSSLLLVQGFSSKATPSSSSSSKVPPQVGIDGDWIAETFLQEKDSIPVVKGPGHVLMYDTTLRGTLI